MNDIWNGLNNPGISPGPNPNLSLNLGNYNYTPQYPRCQIVKVNGEAGARNFRMAPNSSILLLDETAPIVWFIQTDGAGYSNPIPYDITPHQTVVASDITQIDERLKRIEEILSNESNFGNAKSFKKQRQQQQSNSTTNVAEQ